MRSWNWVSTDLAFAVHEMQLARHGGQDGIRDKNAIESALARPKQLATYGEPQPDAADLAAAYAYGIARNHGFSDGNKRTAWIVARVFLLDNNVNINFAALDAIHLMESVASSSLDEKQLAEWFRSTIIS